MNFAASGVMHGVVMFGVLQPKALKSEIRRRNALPPSAWPYGNVRSIDFVRRNCQLPSRISSFHSRFSHPTLPSKRSSFTSEDALACSASAAIIDGPVLCSCSVVKLCNQTSRACRLRHPVAISKHLRQRLSSLYFSSAYARLRRQHVVRGRCRWLPLRA